MQAAKGISDPSVLREIIRYNYHADQHACLLHLAQQELMMCSCDAILCKLPRQLVRLVRAARDSISSARSNSRSNEFQRDGELLNVRLLHRGTRVLTGP